MYCCLCLSLFSIPVNTFAREGDNIVITAKEIREMQVLKLSDVLNDVPGLKAGDSSVSIHGSYKVKVFVDGRPINDPTSSYSAVNWDLISPEDVKRIEILRGKGGLTYGQDAGGGVILITTKDKQQISGNIKAYAGNYDTQDLSASVRTVIGEMSMALSGGFEATDGYKVNNDQEGYQGSLDLNYKLGEDKALGFSIDYLDDERGLSGYPDYPTPHSRKETHNTAYALQADLFGINSKTYYNYGYRHNTDKSRDLDKTLRIGKFGQEITTNLETLDRGKLSCGLGFTWDQASGSSFADQEEHSESIFASQSIHWLKYNLTLTAGLRVNYHSNFENTINPEAQISYKQDRWSLSASYSRSDNTPSFYQRYNETSSTQPNPGLVLEKAENLSLNLFFTLTDSLSVNLSGFYNILSDRITYVTNNKGQGQYQNFGQVLYTGGDLALSWKINPILKLKTNYTYLRVKDQDTGLWLPCKARHQADIDLYCQPLAPLSFVISQEYTSSVYRNKSNTKKIPEYLLTDLRAEYAFEHFSLFSEIENVLDKKYYYADGLLAPPLTWIMGINYQF
jgi:iron complex outermembrane receptor protein